MWPYTERSCFGRPRGQKGTRGAAPLPGSATLGGRTRRGSSGMTSPRAGPGIRGGDRDPRGAPSPKRPGHPLRAPQDPRALRAGWNGAPEARRRAAQGPTPPPPSPSFLLRAARSGRNPRSCGRGGVRRGSADRPARAADGRAQGRRQGPARARSPSAPHPSPRRRPGVRA